MPRKKAEPLSILKQRFEKFHGLSSKKIMICKRYYIHDKYLFNEGAVLKIDEAHPELIQLFRVLYSENKDWFIGDTEYLMQCNQPEKPNAYNWYKCPLRDL